jgi:hypothetical protein
MSNRVTVGLVEEVTIIGNSGSKVVKAKIDSGATKSSIDVQLASELKLGPVIESKLVKSAHGVRLRPVIETVLILKGQRLSAKFTLADRSNLRYPVLIGVNILKRGFLIDPLA